MRTLVIGDIHGQYQALLACFKASAFDYEQDRLIVLGDVCDRGVRVKESFDELLRIAHCVYIIGNHDVMTLGWVKHDVMNDLWLSQGGRLTYLSYGKVKMPAQHVEFIDSGHWFFKDSERLFVHAGFDPEVPIEQQSPELLIWDRRLANVAWRAHQSGKDNIIPGYRDVFIGHSPTILFNSMEPLHFGNLWLMDTGAGYQKMLTIMDVETKEYWQAPCGE